MRSFVAKFSVAALALGLVAGAAQADPVADRQEAMKENGKAMKALAAMAKGEVPFDAAAVAKNADNIVEDLDEVGEMFPPGSETGSKESYAKPEIWSDRAGFDAIRKKAIELAQALAAVTDQAQFGPALGALGKEGCKACHEKFRRPKDN